MELVFHTTSGALWHNGLARHIQMSLPYTPYTTSEMQTGASWGSHLWRLRAGIACYTEGNLYMGVSENVVYP